MNVLRKGMMALSVIAAGTLSAAPALAEDPFAVTAPVVDAVSAVDDADDLEDALESLQDETGKALRVVFVDTFSGYSSDEWAKAAFEISGMSTTDTLLAVAVDSRQYSYYCGKSSFTKEEISSAIESRAFGEWRSGEWADGAEEVAESLGGKAAGSSSGSGGTGALVGGIVVIGAGAGAAYALSRRNRKKRELEASGVDETGKAIDIATQAGSALLQADDGVRAASNELEFARLEFGKEATDDFEKALDSAKAKVARAWELRKLLEDDVPEPAAQARQMNEQILELTKSAQEDIAAQEKKFSDLRGLARNAGEHLADLKVRVGEIAAQMETAPAQFDHLAVTYPESALTTLRTYPGQVATLLEAARKAISDGETCVSEGNSANAAVYARLAEDEIQQARALASKIANARQSFEEASAMVTDGVRSIQADIADANRLGGSDPNIAKLKANAELVVANATGAKVDPFELSARLADAEQALDAALEGVRGAAADRARNKELAERAGKMARTAIDEADQFVGRYSAWVSERPRTQLAAAKRTFNQAIKTDDYPAASQLFNEARTTAVSALTIAQNDVNTASQRQRRTQGPAVGSDLSSILGGMILGSILSGGGHSGGFSSGSFGGSGGRYGGHGGFGGGGFGGGGGFSGGDGFGGGGSF